MALINCPECGKEISDKAKACPNCGYHLEEDEKNKIENMKENMEEEQSLQRENELLKETELNDSAIDKSMLTT